MPVFRGKTEKGSPNFGKKKENAAKGVLSCEGMCAFFWFYQLLITGFDLLAIACIFTISLMSVLCNLKSSRRRRKAYFGKEDD